MFHQLHDDWRAFTRSKPGGRFCAHFHRIQARRSTAGAIARVVFGVALCAIGVVLWFLPGPGWLMILFGVALFSGESERLASGLDRLELGARERGRRVRAWWRANAARS